MNSKEIAKVTNGEQTLKIPVKKGDFVFGDANGYICFLFLCMASASVDMAFGTQTSPQLGTDIELFDQGAGFADVYAGEGSDSRIEGCKINWGDGSVEGVPTKGFGTIRRLTHMYNEPRDYAVLYTCNDSTGAVSSNWAKLHSNAECFSSADCWNKTPSNECEGEWGCEEGSCIWECQDNPSSGAYEAKQNAIDQCISYCSSDDPAIQAQFFAINPSLNPFMDELNIGNTDCASVMDDISECAQNFKTEFNAMIDRVIT